LESGNIIVTFGKNYIEIFNFSQINDNINNKIINQLEKKFEISINNNNNFNNNINNNINNNNIKEDYSKSNINLFNDENINEASSRLEIIKNENSEKNIINIKCL
jgi:hypothetical protein